MPLRSILSKPRIIIFSGKGGVGKTTVAAATALMCSKRGLRTIVISIDIAHSLSDAFRLDVGLHDHHKGKPRRVSENLWVQEVDIQEELEHHWGEISNYFAALLGSTGLADVLAEELAIIPGMEDVISLLYINSYFREKAFDVIVVDCAPTGESLRFIGMPATLDWYIRKVFKLERNLMKVARPLMKRVSDVPLPEDRYFGAIQDLFEKLDGVDRIILDRDTTSVRLVTNAERMVVRESQRAFMYFCLYGLCVDTIVVNRLFPRDLKDAYFTDWLSTQQKSLGQIQTIFDPIPIRTVNILKDEVVGMDKLAVMGEMIYGKEDPSTIFYKDTVYEIVQKEDDYTLKIKVPFISKEYVDLFKEDGDLVVRIGSFKRHIFLPRALTNRKPGKATLNDNILSVHFPK